MPTAPGAEIRDILRICGKAGIPARAIPGIYELLDGSVSVKQVRDVRIEGIFLCAHATGADGYITALWTCCLFCFREAILRVPSRHRRGCGSIGSRGLCRPRSPCAARPAWPGLVSFKFYPSGARRERREQEEWVR